ncbi:MAG: hypothetical protein M3Z36_09790 [Acidobacteriota bacterium]|nr:hypothetical protein [Acidobacteriota bacterium]
MSLTSIYLSSVGLIGLMVLAAFQNRRSGWHKPKTGAVNDLSQIGAIRGSLPAGNAEEKTRVPVPEILPMHESADFTTQLVNLQCALHQHGRAVRITEPAFEHAELKRSHSPASERQRQYSA